MLWPSLATSPTSLPPWLPTPMPATLSFAPGAGISAPFTKRPGRILKRAMAPPARWTNWRRVMLLAWLIFIAFGVADVDDRVNAILAESVRNVVVFLGMDGHFTRAR